MKSLWTPKTKRILELNYRGKSTQEIANITGIKYHTVAGHISRYRLKYFLYMNGLHIVQVIKQIHPTLTIEELAKKFKTSEAVIEAIKKDTGEFREAMDAVKQKILQEK